MTLDSYDSRHCGPAGLRVLLAAAAISVLVACTGAPLTDEERLYSSQWFACDARFQCVVVYDAFCNSTAVNRRFALVYQDWAQQEVARTGERIVCPPPLDANPLAGCVRGRCQYPFNMGRERDTIREPAR